MTFPTGVICRRRYLLIVDTFTHVLFDFYFEKENKERKKIYIERGTVRVWELKKTHTQRERERERENEEVHKNTQQERKR